MSKPKVKRVDTSAQDALIAQQQAELARQRQVAEAEAARLAQEREDELTRLKSRAAGRRSLISGSELGTAETLG